MYKISAIVLFIAAVCSALPLENQVDFENLNLKVNQDEEAWNRVARAALDTADLEQWQHELELEEGVEHAAGDRQARATCDLLSFSAKGISVNHAACAAHCLVNGRGNRGGSCVNGVCICRK